MTFYQIDSSQQVAQIVAQKIQKYLNNKQSVFWIVTGGSAISVAVQASQLLHKTNLSKLTVTLTDERFGPVGQADSNWQQLLEAGFELPGASLLPVLIDQNRLTTTEQYNKNLKKCFTQSNYSLGLFGIGPDGHTAGILPGSPQIDSDQLATSYADNQAPQSQAAGIYRDKDRITMTAKAIAQLDEAIIFAIGKELSLFDKLEQDIAVRDMPAQALKRAKKLTVYNDKKGDKV